MRNCRRLAAAFSGDGGARRGKSAGAETYFRIRLGIIGRFRTARTSGKLCQFTGEKIGNFMGFPQEMSPRPPGQGQPSRAGPIQSRFLGESTFFRPAEK